LRAATARPEIRLDETSSPPTSVAAATENGSLIGFLLGLLVVVALPPVAGLKAGGVPLGVVDDTIDS